MAKKAEKKLVLVGLIITISLSTKLKVSLLMMDTYAPLSNSISRGQPLTVTESMIGLDQNDREHDI